MEKLKQFEFTWEEYHECSATVEATSREEALEKWSDHKYVEFDDDCSSLENIEIDGIALED
jgi:hypothetical protein